MAPRALFLLLALISAVLFLQVAVADEVVDVDGGDSFVTSRATDLIDVHEDAEVADVNESDAADLSDDDAESEDSTVEDPEADDVQGAELNPLARILHERSSKRCWSKMHCKRFYKKPGCCKEMCVDLLKNNKHCGKCGHCCNTTKGYVCHNGCCKKPKKPKPPKHGCGSKKCPSGKLCCGKECKDLRDDCKNCGKCGKKCTKGSLCCEGRCVDKEDYHHCGKCGVKCPYGYKCCYGKCTNISKDPEHCGRCNKPCAHGTKCVYGMCGYGTV